MKRIRLNVVLAVAVCMAMATFANAESKDRFGMAGCGLGSMLFGDDPGKGPQILGATTNGTSGTQTFGITSGTSNCDPKSGPAGAKLYIETNREAVAKDVSRGSGETVAGLSALAGCADVAAVGRTLQSNFGTIFPDVGVPDDHVSSTILGILRSGAGLSCDQLL